MARIRIDDLPPEDESLTPGELERLYGGAGRRPFRPTLEGLEAREMYATDLFVGLSQTGKLVVRGTPENDDVVIRRSADNKQIEVLGGTRPYSFDAGKVRRIDVLMGEGHDRVDLTGLGKQQGGPSILQSGEGTTDVRYIDPAGRSTVDTWSGMKLLSRDATTAEGARVRGEWQRGRWVETTDYPGSTSKLFQERKDVFEYPDGKLLSRRALLKDGSSLVGEWKGGQWVETTYDTSTTPGPLRTRTDIFDRPDGNLLSSHPDEGRGP